MSILAFFPLGKKFEVSALKRRLGDIVKALSYEDLLELKKDTVSKTPLLKYLLSERIKELESNGNRCATCSSALNAEEYVLMFGRNEIKKKAYFCGLDCMEYFFSHLREITSKSVAQEQPS